MWSRHLIVALCVYIFYMLHRTVHSHSLLVNYRQQDTNIAHHQINSQSRSHSVVANVVQWMSIPASEIEEFFIPHSKKLPNLPILAGQLGLNSLVANVVKVGLTNELSVRGPLTLVGPTDVAFATAPAWLNLTDNKKLSDVLQFHVLKKKLMFADIKDENTLDTLLGSAIRFNVYPNNVVTAQCAPIDVVNVDKMASNGVIQEVKQVMKPPDGNLVQSVSQCPDFKTLFTAVKTAGLDSTLSGKGPFTMFAPTEAAFKKLDPQTWTNLLNNKTALTDLLEYHVTSKTYCSVALSFYSDLVMRNGEHVNITVNAETLKINDAVIMPPGVDGSVTNGVMHAIDSVLVPPTLRSILTSDTVT